MIESAAVGSLNPNKSKENKTWKSYLILALAANGLLWSLAFLVLKVKSPNYTSKWAITIPVNNSSTSVDLPGIGRADSENESPFRHEDQDPRENYKFLAESGEILQTTALNLNMSLEDFGEPRIRIVDNSTLMEFAIKGESPEVAQQKALALNQALQDKLTQLRSEEMAQQDRSMQILLNRSQQNLLQAQKNLSDYKAISGLSSTEQLQDLSSSIEDLRRQYSQTKAQLQNTKASFQQLAASLGLSSQQAASALLLRSDELFQQHLSNYTQASAELAMMDARLLPNHPEVVTKQAEKDNAQAQLRSRGQSIVGQAVDLNSLTLPSLGNNSDSDRDLFQELISLHAQEQGLASEAQELEQQVRILETRLQGLSQKESKLEDLKRNVQVAEAVFSSTLTQLDISQSNIFSAYPQIQTLIKPSLPTKPSFPNTKHILLATTLASIFVSCGIISLAWREYYQKQLLLAEYNKKRL